MKHSKQAEASVKKVVHLFFEQQNFTALYKELAEDITWIATDGRELGKNLKKAYQYFLKETGFQDGKLKITKESHCAELLDGGYARVMSIVEVGDTSSGLSRRIRITMLLKREGHAIKIFHVHSSTYNFETELQHFHKPRSENMTGRMQKAIENQELKLYIQPQFDIQTQKIIGGEVLIRWMDEFGSVIEPDQFLPLLEEEGSIGILDLYVLESLCRNMAQWMREGDKKIPMAVNQSARNLEFATQHIRRFIQIVDAYQIPHDLITYEVTETALLHGTEQIIQTFENLKNLGFTVSIDDFGSGYATFHTLHIIHPGELKIDQSLLRGRKRDMGMEIVIRKIIEMAHELEMNVVCEGIEEEEQLEFLRKAGCDIGQGYLISKPLPIEEFRERYLTAICV